MSSKKKKHAYKSVIQESSKPNWAYSSAFSFDTIFSENYRYKQSKAFSTLSAVTEVHASCKSDSENTKIKVSGSCSNTNEVKNDQICKVDIPMLELKPCTTPKDNTAFNTPALCNNLESEEKKLSYTTENKVQIREIARVIGLIISIMPAFKYSKLHSCALESCKIVELKQAREDFAD